MLEIKDLKKTYYTKFTTALDGVRDRKSVV